MSIEGNKQNNIRIMDNLIKGFEVSEAIKALRTNVIFSGEENRSIGVTSCAPGDGKTTISLNLAASLAVTGKKTVLLDTDMRRSILAKYTGKPARIVGLGQYLTGQCGIEDLLFSTDVSNLDIIFSGTRVANPSELLGSRKLNGLVEALKSEYSYIVIDTPPLGRVTDCAVIAPVIDGLLIVINAEQNSYKAVRTMKAQYEKANGKILGVVLNKCDLTDKSSYYGRMYGYGYEYGGGYQGRRAKNTRAKRKA